MMEVVRQLPPPLTACSVAAFEWKVVVAVPKFRSDFRVTKRSSFFNMQWTVGPMRLGHHTILALTVFRPITVLESRRL